LEARSGAKPPSSPTEVLFFCRGEDLLERVEDLDPHAQPLREAVGADRHHHELLEVHVVGRVRPPLRMFIIGTGSTFAIGAAEVAVEREPAVARRRRARWRARRRGSRWRPSRRLFGVPSSSIIARSTRTWS
jgi:hypothetical protein